MGLPDIKPSTRTIDSPKHFSRPNSALDAPVTWSNFYQHVHWINFTALVVVPLIGLVLATRTPMTWQTGILAFTYFFWSGIAITAGSHRLWSHRSYTATVPLRIFLAAWGAAAFEGSARKWATEHRAHHRYLDTDKDPYSANEGLLYSHLGWLIMKREKARIGRVDISDIKADPVAAFQHRHFWPLAIFLGYILPAIIGLAWNDALGAFVYAGILRIVLVNHSIFCVNSLAHYLGDQPFDDIRTPRNHVITALLTFGEGWHNYHHEFPTDYRNGIRFHDFDPTKWCIYVWKCMGLASDLREVKAEDITKSRVQQLAKKAIAASEGLNWGTPLNQLPVFSWDEYRKQAKGGRALVSVAGIIHDVSAFIDEHPGGRAIIKTAIGKDATAMFNGGVYYHSNAAHNILATMRVGLLRGGGEVEKWKGDNASATFVDVEVDDEKEGAIVTEVEIQSEDEKMQDIRITVQQLVPVAA